MRSRRRTGFLRMTNPKEPIVIPEDRTEHEEARRLARDWLRDRTESDVIEFELEDDA
jgi:hypothetical protein